MADSTDNDLCRAGSEIEFRSRLTDSEESKFVDSPVGELLAKLQELIEDSHEHFALQGAHVKEAVALEYFGDYNSRPFLADPEPGRRGIDDADVNVVGADKTAISNSISVCEV